MTFYLYELMLWNAEKMNFELLGYWAFWAIFVEYKERQL